MDDGERLEFLPKGLTAYEAAERVLSKQDGFGARKILGSEEILEKLQTFESSSVRANYLAETLLALPDNAAEVFWQSAGVNETHRDVTGRVGTALLTAAAVSGDVANEFVDVVHSSIKLANDFRIDPEEALFSILRASKTTPEGAAAVVKLIIPRFDDSSDLWRAVWLARNEPQPHMDIESMVAKLAAIHTVDMDHSFKNVIEMAMIGYKSPIVIETEIMKAADTLLSSAQFSASEYSALFELANELSDLNPYKAEALRISIATRASAAKPPLPVSQEITVSMSHKLAGFAQLGVVGQSTSLPPLVRNAYSYEIERRMMSLDIRDERSLEAVEDVAASYYDVFLEYSNLLLNASLAISELGQPDERLENIARIISGSLSLQLFGSTIEYFD